MASLGLNEFKNNDSAHLVLTHCGDEIWVNIGWGNGLLADCTKPLPKPVLIKHQIGCMLMKAIPPELLKNSIHNKN